jgi:drug/metabolite transporter (DMT)-like permease
VSHTKSYVLLTLCCLFWSGNYIAGNVLVAYMPPAWMTFWRWFLAMFLLFPLSCAVEKPVWRDVLSQWKILALSSFLGLTAYNLTLYSALSYTSPLNATLISTLAPSALAAASVAILKERVLKRQAAGFVLSLLGVFVVLSKGDFAVFLALEFNRGDVLMLLAVVIWITYTIIVKLINAPPLAVAASASLASSAMTAPLAFYQGIDPAWLNFKSAAIILFIVVFPSVCSYVFWIIGVRGVGAAKAGVFMNLMPVFAALFSLLSGGGIQVSQVAGGLTVFLGVCLTAGTFNFGARPLEGRAPK